MVAVIDEQIKTLSDRVEKHNQVIERTYKLEVMVADLKADVDAYKGAWK